MLILALVSCVWAVAEDAALLKLKANHDAMIQKMGDVEFLKGAHHFAYFKNVPASVYVLPKQKCVYAEFNDRKLYRVINAHPSDGKLTLNFAEKLVIGEKTYSLGYNIAFMTAERSGGCFVTLDQENSDIMDGRADWSKILACVLKYGEELYSVVKACLQNPDVMECLKIIGPATDIYQCISGAMLGSTVSAVQDRAIETKTIYFSWGWGYSTGFQAAPIYQEMPYAIIGFDSVNIGQASNAWNIIVTGETTGNKVAKVYLAQVTYMCYPTFWSSSVSGTIRCVMQR